MFYSAFCHFVCNEISCNGTTDAGPGVSVSNHDVFYRAAQRIRILKLDYYIRLHLAPGDISVSDVERLQSYVGDAICDGGSLKWKYKTVFSDLTQDEVERLTASDIIERVRSNEV